MQESRFKLLFENTRSPLNYADIRRFYTESISSILNNLPCTFPKIEYGHAYVSLSSVIDHFLAYGFKSDHISTLDDIDSKIGVKGSKFVSAMREKVSSTLSSSIVPMILYLTFWSDDFESNQLRKNRKSIWIKTVTICPPSDQVTSSKYTYLLAIGRKGDDHDKINVLYNKELADLAKCKYRYYEAKICNIPVVVML